MKQEIEVKNLDHLGIVAGIVDELGIEDLVNQALGAEEINDDKIGRVMDDLYEYFLESLWTSLAINTINKYEIKTKYSHLDSSSVSVHGEYKINPKQEGENLEENKAINTKRNQ